MKRKSARVMRKMTRRNHRPSYRRESSQSRDMNEDNIEMKKVLRELQDENKKVMARMEKYEKNMEKNREENLEEEMQYSATQLRPLELIQNEAMRIVLGCPRTAKIEVLRAELKSLFTNRFRWPAYITSNLLLLFTTTTRMEWILVIIR
ncbi:hypothetical protein Pmani_008871 [Petrolisthes manimaculis]|uniref:Uncharacterized protein n=1 Tax=Petrolisthes manimaculis TaxID=1843537 RepID=A0AAE1Q856_9EUCA|nr:hypothetical protein Pmani_008871 [Petrolisthes manimaculis]